jgi:Tfp pilus assembly protein PilF
LEISDRHAILATLLLRMGDTSSAIREYRSAIAAYPMLYEAHLKLGELLITEGHIATAREHLSIAARSPNSGLRAAAEKLLVAIAPAK